MRVERELSFASDLLHARDFARLSPADHGLATELVMGVLRWQSLLDSEILANSGQPFHKLDLEVLVALRLGLCQLRRLSRIPPRAAIHQSVELVKRAHKRSAAGFVNAILRKLAAAGDQPKIASAHRKGITIGLVAHETAHPPWMVERWARAYGVEAAQLICQYDQSVPGAAIRLRSPEAEAQLHEEGIELAPGALLTCARRARQGDITHTHTYKSGLCTIQDEASQLVASLVGKGSRILDCCAAPGGKTLAIADNNPGASIIAVELHPHRARLLQRLLRKPNFPGTSPGSIHVLTADACSLPFSDSFDRVLVDAPCSGTGTLARNPEIKWRLRPEDLSDLQSRQFAILRSAMQRVTVGGRLIYSTCALEKEENEDVVERALAEDRSFRVIECSAELDRLKAESKLTWPGSPSVVNGSYLRTLPGVHPCDGFFVAILERL